MRFHTGTTFAQCIFFLFPDSSNAGIESHVTLVDGYIGHYTIAFQTRSQSIVALIVLDIRMSQYTLEMCFHMGTIFVRYTVKKALDPSSTIHSSYPNIYPNVPIFVLGKPTASHIEYTGSHSITDVKQC